MKEKDPREDDWVQALSKKGKGYLCTLTISGCPLEGYIIPNAEYPGCASLYIPNKPKILSSQDIYTLSKEEMISIIIQNSNLIDSWLINFLGARINETIGDFKFELYKDSSSSEEGVKITNLRADMDHFNQPFSREISVVNFVSNLESQLRIQLPNQSGVVLEPLIL